MTQSRYRVPGDPQVAREVAAFDEDVREFFEERAAIREYSGGMARLLAETAALEETHAYLRRRSKKN